MKTNKIRLHLDNWILYWIELFESIIVILTFAFIIPEWSFQYANYLMKRRCKRHKDNT